MKKIIVIIAVFFSLSCKKDIAKKPEIYPETTTSVQSTEKSLGQELFEGKGNCVACHLVDKKIIGPSIQDIAKIYKTQNANIVTFLKGEGKPIVDPSEYEIMKTNFTITKAMSDAELKAIESYIYSHLK